MSKQSAALPAVVAHWATTEDPTACAGMQGLTLAHFRAQLEDLQDTSITLELNLSTFRTHSRLNLGYMRDKVSAS